MINAEQLHEAADSDEMAVGPEAFGLEGEAIKQFLDESHYVDEEGRYLFCGEDINLPVFAYALALGIIVRDRIG